MDSETLKQKFKALTLWKRDGERAPHKPLLVLYALSRMLRNENRLIPYQEIDVELKRLLQEFGPSRKSYNPHYPFLRLQNDQIWRLENLDRLQLNKSGDAKKSDLLKFQVAGGFSAEIFHHLIQRPKLAKEIIQELLDAHFPETIHEDILQAVGVDMAPAAILTKGRDPDFRNRILRAYEYRCAVCGFDVRLDNFPVALEAAHIKWHQAGGPDIEINGMALCVLHHKLFDRGVFTLSDDLEIMVSDQANGGEGFREWLLRFHGNKIRLPQRQAYLPDPAFRIWHFREVFRGEFRENHT